MLIQWSFWWSWMCLAVTGGFLKKQVQHFMKWRGDRLALGFNHLYSSSQSGWSVCHSEVWMESHLRGISVGSLLVDPKKEKAFHMIYHEADPHGAERTSASTDLYHMIALRGSRVRVCAWLYVLEITMCSFLKEIALWLLFVLHWFKFVGFY